MCIHLPCISDMKVSVCLWVFVCMYFLSGGWFCISDLNGAPDELGEEESLELRSSVPGLKRASLRKVYVGSREKSPSEQNSSGVSQAKPGCSYREHLCLLPWRAFLGFALLTVREERLCGTWPSVPRTPPLYRKFNFLCIFLMPVFLYARACSHGFFVLFFNKTSCVI